MAPCIPSNAACVHAALHAIALSVAGHVLQAMQHLAPFEPCCSTCLQAMVKEQQEWANRGAIVSSALVSQFHHYYRVEPITIDGSQGTRFTHGEDFEGPMVPLLGPLVFDTTLAAAYRRIDASLAAFMARRFQEAQ